MNIDTNHPLAERHGNALDRHDIDLVIAELANDPERVIGPGALGVPLEIFYRWFAQ